MEKLMCERLEGKLDLILSKIDAASTQSGKRFQTVLDDGRRTRTNIVVVGLSLALLIIGVARFYLGTVPWLS